MNYWKSYKVLEMVDSDIYVINLPPNFSIGFTFNIKDLIIYKLQHFILDDPFESLTPLTLSFATLSFAQKGYIDVILDIQFVSIKDDEIQWILAHEHVELS